MKLDYIKDRIKWLRCGLRGHRVTQSIYTNQYMLDLCARCGWARVEPLVDFDNVEDLIAWLKD